MALTIITLIKQVPVPSEMRMGEDGLMDRTKAKSIINIDCEVNRLLNGTRFV
jgi:electron transfer flavoprotein alpha subunit